MRRTFHLFTLYSSLAFGQSESTQFDAIFGDNNEVRIEKDSIINSKSSNPTIIGTWKLKKRVFVQSATDEIDYNKVYMQLDPDHIFKLYNDSIVNVLYWQLKTDTLFLYYESIRDSSKLIYTNYFVPIVALKSNELILQWPEVFEKMRNEIWVLRRRKRIPNH